MVFFGQQESSSSSSSTTQSQKNRSADGSSNNNNDIAQHHHHRVHVPGLHVQRGPDGSGHSHGGVSGHTSVGSIAHLLVGESSGDEESDEREARIRVGKDYQATPPPLIPSDQRRPEQTPERALLVWSPAPHISNTKLDEYIKISKEKYGYNAEQALGMLFWHKHYLDRAIQDLANFTPFPDEWTVEDKVLFEQAFQFHGKSFHRIRQMLPDKTIAQLVKYYYGWKKTRTRTSLMDRQARKLQEREEREGIQEISNNPEVDSETEEDKEILMKPKCFNCGILCHVTHATPKGQMCGTCHQYFTRTGNVRPTTAPMRKDGSVLKTPGCANKHSIFKKNTQPPKGMYVNHDDLVALATGPPAQGEALLKSMDTEIISCKKQVQNNKQLLSNLQKRMRERSSVEPYRIPDQSNKINARWSNEELLLGVQGIRRFGKNFGAIAEVIGTKTESHVRSFFVNYRRRYNLDSALKEYEAENGPSPNDDDELKTGGETDEKDVKMTNDFDQDIDDANGTDKKAVAGK